MSDYDLRVERFVRDYLIESSGLASLPEFTNDDDLLAIGAIDSEAFLELMLLLEQEFGVEIDLLEIDPQNLVSIDGISKTIRSVIG